MNNTQTPVSPTDVQYGSTQNPQVPSGSNLAAPSSNLQNASVVLNDSTTQSISSVGDTTFSPVDLSGTIQPTATIRKLPANHHYPVIVGGGILIVVIVAITWFASKSYKAH